MEYGVGGSDRFPTVKEGSGHAPPVGRLQDAVKFQKATNTLLPVPQCLCFAAVFTAAEPRNERLPCKRTWMTGCD